MKPPDLRRTLLVSIPSEPMQKFEAMLDGIGSWTASALFGIAAALKLGGMARESDRISFEMTADDGAVSTLEIHCDEDETEALVTRLMYRATRMTAEAVMHDGSKS